MFESFFGLPLHPLVVHATVVFVPAAVLAVLLAACWPRFRRWAGPAPLVLAVISLVLVPISTQSGEALEHALPHDDLIEKHSQYADGLLPWVGGLTLVAFGLWWWMRSQRPTPGRFARLSEWLVVVLAVSAVVVSAGTIVQVILIGHSGAAAAWAGVTV
ncbi:MAG: DUF2231 domain-containing protein [Nakamurella sp.]